MKSNHSCILMTQEVNTLKDNELNVYSIKNNPNENKTGVLLSINV